MAVHFFHCCSVEVSMAPNNHDPGKSQGEEGRSEVYLNSVVVVPSDDVDEFEGVLLY